MNSAQVGDLVWVPDSTCGWTHGKTRAITVEGPLLGLVKGLEPLCILVNVGGSQEELSVHRADVYEIGDLYD